MNVSRKKVLLFIIILFFISLFFILFYLKMVFDYKMAVKKTTFSNIEISDIPDGVYVGEYDVNFIYVKVLTQCQEQQIQARS